MIQPLDGNVKISKIADSRGLMLLILVVMVLLAVIIDDKFVNPKKVEFIYASKTQVVKTYENTVDSFLRSQHISLDKGDILLNSLSDPITDGSKIVLIKVNEEVVCEEEPIPFREVSWASKAVSGGSAVEITAGAAGVKKNYYKTVWHNKNQKSREYLGGVIVRRPVDRVILVGSGSGSGETRELVSAPPESAGKHGLSLDVAVVSSKERRSAQAIDGAGVAGVAVAKKGVLKSDSLISVDGYGTFVVKNDEGEYSKYSGQSGSGIVLIIPPGFERSDFTDRRSVRVSLI